MIPRVASGARMFDSIPMDCHRAAFCPSLRLAWIVAMLSRNIIIKGIRNGPEKVMEMEASDISMKSIFTLKSWG
jgi:hypothetical protein